MNYKLSVIIPAYNAEKFIVGCLNSIINQKFNDCEVVIINDGSLDNTEKICLDYIRDHPDDNISLISQTNSGVSVARNRGLKESKGEWITFVDADDALLPGSLEYFYNIRRDNVNVILANYTNKKNKIISDENKVSLDSELMVRCLLHYPKYYRKIKKAKYSIDNYINWTCWGKFFLKEYLIENDIYFPEGISLSEDTIFLVRLYLSKPTIIASNRTIYFYYENYNSVTHTYNEKQIYNNVKVIRCFESLLAGSDLFYEDLVAFVTERIINSYRQILIHTNRKERKKEVKKVSYVYDKEKLLLYVTKAKSKKLFLGKKNSVSGFFVLFYLRLLIKKHKD